MKKIVLLLLLTLAACSTSKNISTTQKARFEKADFSDLKSWEDDDHTAALETFQKSCAVILKRKPNSNLSGLTSLGGKSKDWFEACQAAIDIKDPDCDEAKEFFEKWFQPYKVLDPNGKSIGKFTGYYEIEMHGSKTKTKKFKYPIYKSPHNIKAIKGHAKISHKHINKGALNKKGLEIAYTDNLARLFFMQIQGSGVVKLHEGGELKLGYSEQNGHPYVSIGQFFKDYCSEKIRSATDMIKWLHKNPKVGLEIMEKNPSYVFFKEIKYGPIGGQGIHLTPERSIAIDAKIFPYGTPLWVETTTPKIGVFPSLEYSRLFIAQDTGGAIRGAIRGDIFYGRGDTAEELAGYMNNDGSYYALFPKQVTIPS